MTEVNEASGQEKLGPGGLLARERIARGVSIAELSGRLKYAPRQLEALEADDYSRLPGVTFVRGMIRAYAKQIGIDPAAVLARFELHHVPDPVSVDLRTRRIPFPDGKKRATRVYLVLSLCVLFAVGAILVEWHFGAELWSGFGQSAPIAATATVPVPSMPQVLPVPEAVAVPQSRDQVKEEPMPAPAASPAAVRKEPAARISLEFQRDSWVEIRDNQGRTLLSQLNPGGTQKLVEGDPPFSVIIGNAHGVRLLYNDSQVDLRPYVKVEVARLTLE